MKVLASLILLFASLPLFAQSVVNCASATAPKQTDHSVTLTGFQLQNPGDSIFLWATALATSSYRATAQDAVQAYPLLANSPADIQGYGAAFLLQNATYDGSPIMVTWSAPSTGNTTTAPLWPNLIACELPPMTGNVIPPVLSHDNFIYSLPSGTLPSAWGLHVYCVEAGLSRMIPFTAGQGYYLPANSQVQPGACQFEDSGNDTQTVLSWPIDAFHVSSVFFGVY